MASSFKNINSTMDHRSRQEAYENIYSKKDKRADSPELEVTIKMEEPKEACERQWEVQERCHFTPLLIGQTWQMQDCGP